MYGAKQSCEESYFRAIANLIFWNYSPLDSPLGDEPPSLGPRLDSPIEEMSPAVPKGIFSPGSSRKGTTLQRVMHYCQGAMTTQPV